MSPEPSDAQADTHSAVPPDPAEEVTAQQPQPSELDPAEQMALFEKDLQENDWGHQPC